MTIHSEHPFLPPENERNGVRRLRSRLGGTVSLWTTGSGDRRGQRVGLTVSSLVVADGEPAHLLGLLDPDSDFVDALLRERAAVVQLLEWEHRDLADAFAGMAPAPGGVFRMGEWRDTDWGPLLSGASAWAGVRLAETELTQVGWSALVSCVIEHVEIGDGSQPLVHRRGRYQRPSGA